MGFAKTVRLCLVEYLISLVLHVVYAFYHCGTDTGRVVLLVSIIMFTVSFIVPFAIKKEGPALITVYVSIVMTVSAIGYLVGTLSYSLLIFAVLTAIISVFMEAKYIIINAAVSVTALVAYMIFIPEAILVNIESLMMYGIYILIYIAEVVNLCIVVSSSKKYMKGMEEKTEEAERANESKMRFLANMSHEIRTPMNAICGMAELTLRDESLSDDVRENTESIQNAGKVLLSIVNDILDYSKMESGKLDIIPVTYSFSSLIDDVVNMMEIRIDDKDVEIRTDVQKDIPDVLIGDEIRIRQILFNLLSNAIKYTEKGYVILDAKCVEEGGFADLTISVTDSGIGIRKEDVGKLFTGFQQFDTRKNKTNEGTGLGLAICKQLLELMGGSIEVESTYGVGSKFTIHISQKVSDDKAIVSKSPREVMDDDKVLAPDAKVLVVDDNAVNLKVAQGLLRTFGLSVDTATSGRQCLEILATAHDYDIIFIDHMMPELDGIDTLNMIRADSSEYLKKVPCIALTANVVSGVREMFISEGFDDYVPKPIDMIWLNAILRKYLPSNKQR